MGVSNRVSEMREQLSALEQKKVALALDLSQAEGEQIADEVGAQIAALQERLTVAAAKAAREKAARVAELQAAVDTARASLDEAVEGLQKARSSVASAEKRLKNARGKLVESRRLRSVARSALENVEHELVALS